MKQIIKFLKKMSVENALFFFSMFGVAMMAFAFMGGNMRSSSTTSTRLHRFFRER